MHDEVKDRYVCGSSSFTNAGLLWFTVVMVVVTTIALSYYSGNNGYINTKVERRISDILLVLYELRTRFMSSSDLTRVKAVISNHLNIPTNEIQQFHTLGQATRFATGIVTAVFVLVKLPLYCIFSFYFGTYSITYAWTASAAYLSGLVPGVVLMLLYVGIIVVPCYCHRSYLRRVLLHYHEDNSIATSDTRVNDCDDRPRKERNISMISVLTLARKHNVKDSISKETIEMVQLEVYRKM